MYIGFRHSWPASAAWVMLLVAQPLYSQGWMVEPPHTQGGADTQSCQSSSDCPLAQNTARPEKPVLRVKAPLCVGVLLQWMSKPLQMPPQATPCTSHDCGTEPDACGACECRVTRLRLCACTAPKQCVYCANTGVCDATKPPLPQEPNHRNSLKSKIAEIEFRGFILLPRDSLIPQVLHSSLKDFSHPPSGRGAASRQAAHARAPPRSSLQCRSARQQGCTWGAGGKPGHDAYALSSVAQHISKGVPGESCAQTTGSDTTGSHSSVFSSRGQAPPPPSSSLPSPPPYRAPSQARPPWPSPTSGAAPWGQ